MHTVQHLLFSVDAAQRRAVIERLGKQLKANYIFADVANKVAADISSKEAGGAYDSSNTAASFALTKDLRRDDKDLHLRVDYDPTFKAPPDNDDTKPATA